MKKLIYLFLGLLIVACSSEDSSNDTDNNNNNPNCEYVLNTLPVTDIEDAIATFNGIISIDSNCEFPITEQGFVYATTIQPTLNNNQVNVNGNNVTTTINNQRHMGDQAPLAARGPTTNKITHYENTLLSTYRQANRNNKRAR